MLQMSLIARAQGWHVLMLVLPLQPGEARGQRQHHPHHMDTVSCMHLSGFTRYFLASDFSFWVTVSKPFHVKAPQTPSEKHLPSTFTSTEIKIFSILSPFNRLLSPASSCQQLPWPCTKEPLWLHWHSTTMCSHPCSPEGASGLWGTLRRCA